MLTLLAGNDTQIQVFQQADWLYVIQTIRACWVLNVAENQLGAFACKKHLRNNNLGKEVSIIRSTYGLKLVS